MSAIDYLRHLQASLPYSGGVPDEILKQRIQQSKKYADFIATFQPSLESTEESLRKNLITPFLSCIPVEEAHALHEIPVGVLPIHEPNAWAIQTPAGDYLIVLHTEMSAVLSYYKELQAASREVHEQSNTTDKLVKELGTGLRQLHEQHEIDKALDQVKKNVQSASRQLHEQESTLDKIASLNRDCFRIIFDSFLHKRSVDFPPIPVTVSERHLWDVQLATCANELFIIAHEFAHIALGHTGKIHAISLRRKGAVTKVRKITWEQQQELDADLKAIKWLHQLDRNSESIFIRFAAMSPIMCAEVLMLIHFLEAYAGFPTSASSHPPALVRMKYIFSQAYELLSEFDRWWLAEMIRRAEATSKLEF